MKKTEDLKSLLDKLKAEASYDYELEERKTEEPKLPVYPRINKTNDANFSNNRNNSFSQFKAINPKFNVVWSENKESLLFSILSSVIVVIIGVITSLEYITLVGLISFLLFSIVTFLAFFRYVLIATQKEQMSSDVALRLEKLEREISNLSQGELGGNRIFELEEKIEELRIILKSNMKLK
jgi:ABC-type multidrug transport system fused ATPase/permease subunit